MLSQCQYVREGVFLTQTSVMVPGGSPPWRAVSRPESEVGINPLPTPPELLRDSLYRSRTCNDSVSSDVMITSHAK